MTFPVFALALVALAGAAPPTGTASARARGWRTDYAAARAEARKAGKPLFVVFRCEP